MTSRVDFSANVPTPHLPVLNALLSKLAKGARVSMEDAIHKYDADLEGFGSMTGYVRNSPRVVIRDGRSKDAMMVGVWAQLIESGKTTIREMYDQTIPVIMPDDFKVLPRVGFCWNKDRNACARIITSTFATYSIMGIDKSDWEGWGNDFNVHAPPHLIYRYMEICQDYGVPSITPSQYLKLARAIASNGGRVSMSMRLTGIPDNVTLSSMNDWAMTVRDLMAAGHDPSKIDNLGSWVADDGWGIDSLGVLAVNNVDMADANKLWANGIHDVELIRMHLVDGVPLEWVEGMFAERDGAVS